MTNIEFSNVLSELSTLYKIIPDNIKQFGLNIFLNTKDEVKESIKAIGGKWNKNFPKDDREYSLIKIESLTYPGLTLLIYRDYICKKIVKYDCEPLFSQEEENNLLNEES